MDARFVPRLAVTVYDTMDLPATMPQWIAQKRWTDAEKEPSRVTSCRRAAAAIAGGLEGNSVIPARHTEDT
jgi:hypothetical protein